MVVHPPGVRDTDLKCLLASGLHRSSLAVFSGRALYGASFHFKRREAREEHGPSASWLRQGPGWGQPVRWRSDQPSPGSAPTFRAPTFGFVFVPSPEGSRFRRATARGSTGPIFPRIPAPRQGSGRIVSSPTFKLSVHAWEERDWARPPACSAPRAASPLGTPAALPPPPPSLPPPPWPLPMPPDFGLGSRLSS
jgi:hypothetical protein